MQWIVGCTPSCMSRAAVRSRAHLEVCCSAVRIGLHPAVQAPERRDGPARAVARLVSRQCPPRLVCRRRCRWFCRGRCRLPHAQGCPCNGFQHLVGTLGLTPMHRVGCAYLLPQADAACADLTSCSNCKSVSVRLTAATPSQCRTTWQEPTAGVGAVAAGGADGGGSPPLCNLPVGAGLLLGSTCHFVRQCQGVLLNQGRQSCLTSGCVAVQSGESAGLASGR